MDLNNRKMTNHRPSPEDGVEARRRRAEHFEQVLNVADVRVANINVVGNWRMPVLGDLNGRAISLEEVTEAVN